MGARPGRTCKAISGGPTLMEKDECWLLPQRKPGVRQKKQMIGCLIKLAIKLVMKNHYYSFNNIIKKQSKGGAMVYSLTEKVGKLMMKRFAKKFKALLEKLQIEQELLKSFVDDVTEMLLTIFEEDF